MKEGPPSSMEDRILGWGELAFSMGAETRQDSVTDRPLLHFLLLSLAVATGKKQN